MLYGDCDSFKPTRQVGMLPSMVLGLFAIKLPVSPKSLKNQIFTNKKIHIPSPNILGTRLENMGDLTVFGVEISLKYPQISIFIMIRVRSRRQVKKNENKIVDMQ